MEAYASDQEPEKPKEEEKEEEKDPYPNPQFINDEEKGPIEYLQDHQLFTTDISLGTIQVF